MIHCPICGSTLILTDHSSTADTTCPHCHYQRLKPQAVEQLKSPPTINANSIKRLLSPNISIDSPTEHNQMGNIFKQTNKEPQLYNPKDRDLSALISDHILTQCDDINATLRHYHISLKNHGELLLACSVNRSYRQPRIYSHDQHLLTSKNIMLLLEQHGFRMKWRQSRFSRDLVLIAQKM